VAKTAGFCFGVDNAVKTVEKKINSRPLYTYGPIIHNQQVVDELKEKGVNVIYNLEELETIERGTILIRSHGVGKDEVDKMEEEKFNVIDATCPYVKRIHKIVSEYSSKGYKIIIVGNPNHPEVQGIKGWSNSTTYIIEDELDIDKLKLNIYDNYCLVTQTTFNYIKYKSIVNKLKKKNIHVIINETICKATEERQKEAIQIAKKVTKMIVIGGKHSSNTQKLYEICKEQCDQTYHIETIQDLELNVFNDSDIIGITAGASTPKNIIEEVILNVTRTKF